MKRVRGFVVLISLGIALSALPSQATADGTPDPTFSSDGRLILDPVPGFANQVSDVAVDNKGRIVIAGSTNKTGEPVRGYVLRLLGNGTPDVSFGTNGFTEVNAGNNTTTQLTGIALDSKGRIAVGGFAQNPPKGFDFFVTRLLDNGDPDPAFVSNTLDFGTSATDAASAVTVDRADRIILSLIHI